MARAVGDVVDLVKAIVLGESKWRRPTGATNFQTESETAGERK